MSEVLPYIGLNFEGYEPKEIARIQTDPRLRDAMELFENIKASTRERMASISLPTLVATTMTPGASIPFSPDAIRKALADKKITAAIQPYRELSDNNLQDTSPRLADMKGCEALMKIIKDAETLARAGDAINTADTVPGLTSQIDLAVLENASILILIINELRKGIGLEPIPIAFNCSLDLVSRENFANDILEVLEETDTPYEFCTIEILEKIQDLDERQIKECKKLSNAGVHIAIDDFDQRINGGEENDPVLEKLKAAGIPILRLKVDGKTTHTLTTAGGYAKAEKIVQTAIVYGVQSIVFEGGYDNLTTVTVAHLRTLEGKYGSQIKFLVEGTIVDAVATGVIYA